jgi:hypothetical protein
MPLVGFAAFSMLEDAVIVMPGLLAQLLSQQQLREKLDALGSPYAGRGLDTNALLAAALGSPYPNMSPATPTIGGPVPPPTFADYWQGQATPNLGPMASPMPGLGVRESQALKNLVSLLNQGQPSTAPQTPMYRGLSPAGTPRAGSLPGFSSGVTPRALFSHLAAQAQAQQGVAGSLQSDPQLLGTSSVSPVSLGLPFLSEGAAQQGQQGGVSSGAWPASGDIAGTFGLPQLSIPRIVPSGSAFSSPRAHGLMSLAGTTPSMTPIGTPVKVHGSGRDHPGYRWDGLSTGPSSPRTGEASSLGGSWGEGLAGVELHTSEPPPMPGATDGVDVNGPAGEYALPAGLFDDAFSGGPMRQSHPIKWC